MTSEPGVSYAFARRPKWIVWHVIAVAAVVAMVNLGFWQLRRLDERRTENAKILAREQQAPVDASTLIGPDSPPGIVGSLAFRVVTASGEYQAADQVLVRNRTNGGAPGFWVLTPLRGDDGIAFVINRGWIPLPFGEEGGNPADYAPPTGRITVTGMVQVSQVREGIGIEDPPTGRLATLSRVDVPRLGQQVGYPLAAGYLDLRATEPPSTRPFPSPIPPPELDDGSHLNYAGQWFIFSTLTVITYPLLLRRTARRNALPPGAAEPDADPSGVASAPARG